MEFTDQCGNIVRLSRTPGKIVSLVPSQTELLHDLGAGNSVAGITRFCIHPAHWLKEKTIVGGTKNFQHDIIDQLKPDLIIGNKEENYREGIEQLQRSYPVWMSDIFNLDDALSMISSIGKLTDTQQRADGLVAEITKAFSGLKKTGSQKVLYLIWRKPWMAVASNTFINSLLNQIGYENCVAEKLRYPELTSEEIEQLNPALIMLSSEPYPFREKHIAELKAISPHSKIILVDGEMFSWYGSRLRLAPAYFNSLQSQ
jgi:ABC-type Fe3+-hydroxamate transport system substrate-binding protein